MSERVQEERRWTPADRLEMKRDQALAERDRLAEVAEELAGALEDLDDASPTGANVTHLHRRVDAALVHYEALKEEAKAQAPKPHEQ